jgi:hypothetical protein
MHILYHFDLRFVTPSLAWRTEPISCDSHTKIQSTNLKVWHFVLIQFSRKFYATYTLMLLKCVILFVREASASAPSRWISFCSRNRNLLKHISSSANNQRPIRINSVPSRSTRHASTLVRLLNESLEGTLSTTEVVQIPREGARNISKSRRRT